MAVRVSGDPVAANNGLFYIYSDHASTCDHRSPLSTSLGSTSVLSTAAGSEVANSTTRYLPFGGYRGTAPTQTITDRDFTGQKENRELGLLYYNARFYAPGLGRFLSADTIVPNPANPQSYNRYSYGYNNPLRYVDPNGHCGADVSGGTVNHVLLEQCTQLRDNLTELYDIVIEGTWAFLEMRWLAESLTNVSIFVGGAEQLIGLFQDALTNKGSTANKITFERTNTAGQGAGWNPIPGKITLGPTVFAPDNFFLRDVDTRPISLGLFNREGSAQVSILHEIGHILIDARPEIIGDYRQERQWGTRDPGDNTIRADSEGPHDGRSTFPGHINPFEDLATSLAIFVASDGANYPAYQFQMDFMRDNQNTWK